MSSSRDDFRRVLKSLSERLDISGEISAEDRSALEERNAQRKAENKIAAEKEAADNARLIDLVKQFKKPIKGTPAEAYLKCRAITQMPRAHSAAFLPANALGRDAGLPFANLPSLVLWARDDDTGRVTGGQRVILHDDGSRAQGTNGSKLGKLSFGSIAGSSVQFPAKEGARPHLFICESPEAAASISEATGCEVWAVLGASGFGAVTPLDDIDVILCPDQDAEGSPAYEQFSKAADRLYYDLGVDLKVARAYADLGSKDDLNDMHQEHGIKSVIWALGEAIPYEQDIAFKQADAEDSATAERRASLIALIDRLENPSAETIEDWRLRATEAQEYAEMMGDSYDTSEAQAARDVSLAVAKAELAALGAPILPSVTDHFENKFKNITDAHRKAIIADRSSQLNDTITSWARKHGLDALARRELRLAFAAIDLKHGDAQTTTNRKARRQAMRAARKAVKDKLGLDYMPSTNQRRVKPEDSTLAFAGLVYDCIMITGAQGIGKTAAFIGSKRGPGALHTEGLGADTLFLSPDSRRSKDAYLNYVAAAPVGSDHPEGFLLRGRSALNDEGETMCMTPAAAESAAKRGMNVRKDLCMNCPFADQCSYMAQEAEIERLKDEPNGSVIFATHPYLFLPLPAGMTPTMKIVDETPSGSFTEVVTVMADDLSATLLIPADLDVARQADLNAGLGSVRMMAATLSESLKGNSNALDDLKALGITQDDVTDAIATCQAFRALGSTMQSFSGSNDAEEADAALCAYLDTKDVNAASKLIVLFKAILIDMQTDVPAPNGFDIRKGAFKAWVKRSIHHKNAALCYLDGTAQATLTEAQFGKLRTYRFEVPRNAKITQVTGKSFSDSSIVGKTFLNTSADGLAMAEKAESDAQTLRADLHKVFGRYDDLLFVAGTRKTLTALKVNDTVMHRNFGALRGSNEFSGCSSALIIGRMQPPTQALEDEAIAYAAAAGVMMNHVDSLVKQTVTVEDAQGVIHQIEVEKHPHPFAEAIRQQKAEAEIEQAVDRLRLIHSDERREIVILSEHPCVAPDVVMPWKDFKAGGSKMERLIKEMGFLPRGAAEAFRLAPDLFGSLGTARRAFLEAPSLSHSPIESLTRVLTQTWCLPSDKVFEVRYRLKPKENVKQPRLQTAYVPAETIEAAKTVIEAATGPLKEFSLVCEMTMRDAETAVQPEMTVRDTSEQAETEQPSAPMQDIADMPDREIAQMPDIQIATPAPAKHKRVAIRAGRQRIVLEIDDPIPPIPDDMTFGDLIDLHASGANLPLRAQAMICVMSDKLERAFNIPAYERLPVQWDAILTNVERREREPVPIYYPDGWLERHA